MKRKPKNPPNKFRFVNEMSLAKQQFIQIIQEMSDDEFIAFMFAVNDFIDFISINEKEDDFEDDDS